MFCSCMVPWRSGASGGVQGFWMVVVVVVGVPGVLEGF